MSKNRNAVALGRLGGRSKSKAKTDAARENGKKGGRPRLCKKLYAYGFARAAKKAGDNELRCSRKAGHAGPCSGDYC
jgi:hypothetical protein